METVNNVVSQATKLIWGESQANTQTTEPVSGQTGAGTVNEPYDKGNIDASNIASTTTTGTTGTTTSSVDPSSTMTSTSTDPTSNTLPSTNDPATAAHSTSTEPGQKQQGADRPTDAPNAAQTEAVKDKANVAEAEQEGASHPKVTDENREDLAAKGELPTIPNDHSGEPMKMHGGTAKEATEDDSADPRTEGKTDRSKSVSHEGGGEHGKVEGTGEKWVKTSGLAAEGGDFDATKPGAGKEANRILDEKGIKKDDRGVMSTEDGSSPSIGTSSTEGVKKESKMAKLKEKLHIGTGKKLDTDSK